MQSKATTVAEYLAELPEDRRAALEAVREVILRNLDKDYIEGMAYGMIGYYVPHSVFPAGYHCDPSKGLPFAGMASQKNHMSVYLMGLYCGCVDGVQDTALVRWFHEAWAKAGKKLDMGKACIRFKRADDLALEVLGEAVGRMPAKTYIEMYTAAMRDMGRPVNGSGARAKGKAGAAARPAKAKGAVGAAKAAATRGSAKGSAKQAATKRAGNASRKARIVVRKSRGAKAAR